MTCCPLSYQVHKQALHSTESGSLAVESYMRGCARFGHTVKLAELLESGVNVQSTNGQGYTALHWAASAGQLPCSQLLISKGAKRDARTREGFSPAVLAAMRGHGRLASLLLEGIKSSSCVTLTGGPDTLMGTYFNVQGVMNSFPVYRKEPVQDSPDATPPLATYLYRLSSGKWRTGDKAGSTASGEGVLFCFSSQVASVPSSTSFLAHGHPRIIICTEVVLLGSLGGWGGDWRALSTGLRASTTPMYGRLQEDRSTPPYTVPLV